MRKYNVTKNTRLTRRSIHCCSVKRKKDLFDKNPLYNDDKLKDKINKTKQVREEKIKREVLLESGQNSIKHVKDMEERLKNKEMGDAAFLGEKRKSKNNFGTTKEKFKTIDRCFLSS